MVRKEGMVIGEMTASDDEAIFFLDFFSVRKVFFLWERGGGKNEYERATGRKDSSE